MKLRAVIIDDELKGIETIKILVEDYIDEVLIVSESTDPQVGIKLINDYQPELVFLDINMPGLTGFELLEKITWKNFNLIFTTAHEEYALKALKASAIDYLLKPIDHEDLRFAVDKVIKHLSSEAHVNNKFNINELLGIVDKSIKQKIIISSKSGIESLDIVEIVSLESNSNYTLIQMESERTILVSRGLKEFEKELCETNLNFMRVHHSYIVNLQKVIRYLKNEDSIIMKNNKKIPIAKSRKQSFYKWLNIRPSK